MRVDRLLTSEIQKNANFFHNEHSAQTDRDIARDAALRFLASACESSRETWARIIIRSTLGYHAKNVESGSVSEMLHLTEIQAEYEHKAHRKHLVHSLNVYLLGLLIYNRVTQLRKPIDNEMATTKGTNYSGGNEHGEFLFRWKSASLTHDIGNGISLFYGDKDRIAKYLSDIQIAASDYWDCGKPIVSIEELLRLNGGRTSIELLDELAGDNKLSHFMNTLAATPFRKITHDHGLMSAAISLKMLYKKYRRMDGAQLNIAGHIVSFDKEYFYKSLVNAYYAVCLHNLDFYDDGYLTEWPDNRIYDSQNKPFAYLLKICDLLQEWHKVKVTDDTDFVRPEEIELEFTEKRIIVRKHPRAAEIMEKLKKYFWWQEYVEILTAG